MARQMAIADNNRSQDIARALHRLSLSYPRTSLGNPQDPLNDLIYIILSGQTNEELYSDIYRLLRKKFPRWQQVLSSADEELESPLRRGGLSYQKANYIRKILEQIKRDFGKLSLAPLRQFETTEAEKYLTSLPGVGTKTARCVLMYTMDREVFPLDVHCRRIMERMGWCDRNGGRAESIADSVQSLIPRNLRRDLHIHLVQHGRQICHSKNKQCSKCLLSDICKEAGGSKYRRPTVVDLCCGAGGFSLGFLLAGYRILLGMDKADDALMTYGMNIPGSKTLAADLSVNSTLELVQEQLGKSIIDVVIAGPPCQGFSRAGRRAQSDDRNQLYAKVMQLAVRLDPAVIVFENVANLNSSRFGQFLKRALSVARRHGYSSHYSLVNAASFGVPQNRSRNILLATRNAPRSKVVEILESLSSRQAARKITVREAFRGLPVHPTKRDFGYNHEPMKHSKGVSAKISRIQPGSGPLSYRKLDPERSAPTLICGNRAFPCHFQAPRTITVREAARIQGFPDSYLFQGSRSCQMQQVADAVPPLLGLGIAVSILTVLKHRQPATLGRIVSSILPCEGGNGDGLLSVE